MRSSGAPHLLALAAALMLPARGVAGMVPAGHVIILCTAHGPVKAVLGGEDPRRPPREDAGGACHAACLGSRKPGLPHDEDCGG